VDAILFMEKLGLSNAEVIRDAEMKFIHARGRFGALSELGPAEANLIKKELSSGEYQGYTFEVITVRGELMIRAIPKPVPNKQLRRFLLKQNGDVFELGVDNIIIGPVPSLRKTIVR